MDETHELLLALAGRVDDDLLAWARELVAVGEDTRAVELVTAGLSADRVALPADVRAAAVAAATAARIDLDADAALPPAAADDPGTGHRFTSDREDEALAAAVSALPKRLLDGAGLHVAWRLTPAGSAPGPLPHPVLLVEVAPGGRPADALAYQLQVALERAGVVASVEVLISGRPVPAYHVAARREARPLGAEPLRAEPAEEPAPVMLDEQEPVSPAVPLRPASDAGGRRRRVGTDPAARPAEQRRPTVTPISRNALPSPVPLLRRDGGPARPLVPVEHAEAVDEQPAAEGRLPAPAETPTFRSMQDPLSGPLNAPLLAPLLDPTPVPDEDGYDDDQEYDNAVFGGSAVSPLAPEGGAPIEDGWAGEWASGDWAVASTGIDDAEPATPVTPVAPAAPEPRPAARHRFNGPPPPPLPAPPPAPVQQRPVPEPPDTQRPNLGLRPDSLARLSDADRELLARLQAELGAAARKPRLTRRAGVTQNGNGHPPHPA